MKSAKVCPIWDPVYDIICEPCALEYSSFECTRSLEEYLLINENSLKKKEDSEMGNCYSNSLNTSL